MSGINDIFNLKVVEPMKRNKDGLRWIVHRFPIKGGISMRQALIFDLSLPNPVLETLKCRM